MKSANFLFYEFCLNTTSAVLKYYSRYREMILIRAGSFWMGTNDRTSKTGEYPMKFYPVKSFYLDANPVINADFW